MKMLLSVIAGLAMMLTSSDAEAGRKNRCSSRCSVKVSTVCSGRTYSSTVRQSASVHASGENVGSMQAWAENEARMMSERGTNGHVRGAPMGTFVGVGGCNGRTCQGKGTLVGEATYKGKTVRVWKP